MLFFRCELFENMFVLENSNNKIKGIRFGINNDIKLFLTDGDVIEIQLSKITEEDFIKTIKNIDDGISNDFLKNIYNFKNDKKE